MLQQLWSATAFTENRGATDGHGFERSNRKCLGVRRENRRGSPSIRLKQFVAGHVTMKMDAGAVPVEKRSKELLHRSATSRTAVLTKICNCESGADFSTCGHAFTSEIIPFFSVSVPLKITRLSFRELWSRSWFPLDCK